PSKLLNIIKLSEERLGIEDAEIEVEYQSEIEDSQSQNGQLKKSLQTIGKYGLAFDGTNFILQNKTTACLAQDACGIPSEKVKKRLEIEGKNIILQNKTTDCLAKDACGIPSEKVKKNLNELSVNQNTSCTPGGGCC